MFNLKQKTEKQRVAGEFVYTALERLGLRSGTIANCKVLSREMERSIGRKVSGITLFRMLYPEKYGVSPYQYTIDLLEEFLETTNYKSSVGNPDHEANPFISRKVPSQTALYKLLSMNLHNSETDLLLGFMEDLPMDHLALGWERHIIGKALGDFVVNELGSRRPGSTFEAIIAMPQMRTYYFETYVDYNQGLSVFGNSLEQMLDRSAVRSRRAIPSLLSCADQQWIASCLFAYLMLHFFSWLSEDEQRQRFYRRLLISAAIEEFVEAHSRTFTFIRFRYEAFKLIEGTGVKGTTTALEAEEWLAYLSQFSDVAKPWEMEFATVLIADALVMVKDRSGLERLVSGLPLNPTFEPVVQPVYIRARLYRELISGASDERVEQVFRTGYHLGEGETAYHLLTMDRAMGLFGRNGLTREERSAWIRQTGFTRFASR